MSIKFNVVKTTNTALSSLEKLCDTVGKGATSLSNYMKGLETMSEAYAKARVESKDVRAEAETSELILEFTKRKRINAELAKLLNK